MPLAPREREGAGNGFPLEASWGGFLVGDGASRSPRSGETG